MAFQIEQLDFYPGDTLLVHFTKETAADEMCQMLEYLQEEFPLNKVIATNDYFIDKFSVLHNKERNDFL